MPERNIVLEIDKPRFTVKLYESTLKIDLKGTVKNEIEEALENKPVLRETIGRILGIFIPLHIRLSAIDAVKMDRTDKVRMHLPRHRDIVIPLETTDAKRLVETLNRLIPKEKERELERIMRENKLQKTAEEKLELGRAAGPFVLPSPALEAPWLSDQVEEAVEKEEQKKKD